MKSLRPLKSLIPVVATLFLSTTASAATRYVAPNGNDAAAGTVGAPWAVRFSLRWTILIRATRYK